MYFLNIYRISRNRLQGSGCNISQYITKRGKPALKQNNRKKHFSNTNKEIQNNHYFVNLNTKF